MKIVACYKWVVDEADIIVSNATKELDFSKAGRKISLYDKNAIEMGVQLAQKTEGECVSLSIGAEGADKSKKDVLSRGVNAGYFVQDPLLSQADAHVTSNVLAEKVRAIGDVDLVICGEGAGDDYAQQVGPRIAQVLGWPVATYVKDVEIVDGKAVVTRVVEEGDEVIELALPAVVTSLGDCNTPRIPMMKDIMSAGKKPYEVTDLAALGLDEALVTPVVKTVSCVGNSTDRKNIVITGSPQEAASEMVRVLAQESAL